MKTNNNKRNIRSYKIIILIFIVNSCIFKFNNSSNFNCQQVDFSKLLISSETDYFYKKECFSNNGFTVSKDGEKILETYIDYLLQHPKKIMILCVPFDSVTVLKDVELLKSISSYILKENNSLKKQILLNHNNARCFNNSIEKGISIGLLN